MPFISLSILGTNLIKRKNLKTLNILNINKKFKSNILLGKNIEINDGRAIIISTKSKVFQPLLKYFFRPNILSFTISSTTKTKVKNWSKISNIVKMPGSKEKPSRKIIIEFRIIMKRINFSFNNSLFIIGL